MGWISIYATCRHSGRYVSRRRAKMMGSEPHCVLRRRVEADPAGLTWTNDGSDIRSSPALTMAHVGLRTVKPQLSSMRDIQRPGRSTGVLAVAGNISTRRQRAHRAHATSVRDPVGARGGVAGGESRRRCDFRAPTTRATTRAKASSTAIGPCAFRTCVRFAPPARRDRARGQAAVQPQRSRRRSLPSPPH